MFIVFAFAQHRGEAGFTQRDIMTEVLTGFGKLEARNVVRALSEKLKWIEKCGTKEDGKQKHHLFRTAKNLSNPDLKYSDLPAYKYSQFKDTGNSSKDFQIEIQCDADSTNDISKSQLSTRRRSLITDLINLKRCIPDYRFKVRLKRLRYMYL